MVKPHNEARQQRIEARRLKLYYYLVKHPCVDCGEIDIVVLEFDHVRGKKSHDVNRMLSKDYSWTKIEEEIVKCDVRCANCHRRRTAHKYGHWKVCLDTPS